MDLVNNFLQQDLHKAVNVMACASNCHFSLKMAIYEEDYKKARIAAENIARSFKVLEQLNDKKRHRDGLERLANDLGIETLEKIRKWS